MNQRRLTVYSFIYRGASSALTFINGAVAARYLPKAERGLYQLTTTYSSSGQSFSGGFSNYFSWSLPRRPEQRNQIVQMGNFVMFMFSILAWLVASGVAWFGHPSQTVMYALIGMPLTFLFGYGSRLLNSLGEISWLNRANIAQAVSFLLFYLIFIVFNLHMPGHTKLVWTYRIWILSWAVCVAITLTAAYMKMASAQVLKWRWSNEEWKGLRTFGSWSSLAILSGYVNYRIDYWMLGWMTGNANLISTYGVAVAAAEILNTLTQSISTMVFHRVTAATTDEAGAITEGATRQTLITSVIGALVLAVLMPVLVAVYSWVKYGGAIGPFYVLLPGLVLKATANVVGQYFTNAQGKPLTLLWVNTMVIFFNALICFFLIPYLGMYGSSIASSVAYLFELSVYVFWYHRVSGRDSRNLWRLHKSDFAPYVQLARTLQRRVLRRA